MNKNKQELKSENSILQRKLHELTVQLEENQQKFKDLEEDFMRAIEFMHKQLA